MFLCAGTVGAEPTGPVVTKYSDIYLDDGQWRCPLCNEVVENGDRSDVDVGLHLSEWHDVYLDADYFRDKITEISDAELLASLTDAERFMKADGTLSPEKVKAWFVQREDIGRLYHYDRAANIPFLTTEEFRQQLEADPARLAAVRAAGDAVVDPERGYTLAGRYFGWEVDYNVNWTDRSKYGFHYLHFVTDLVTAWVATGEERYAEAFESLFKQWYAQRNEIQAQETGPGVKVRNVVWYELGLGVRTPRFIDAMRAMGAELSPETHVQMLKYLLGAGRWMHQCLEQTPFHPYNWQTQTAMTQTYLALLYPEFKESGDWLATSRANMIQHFQEDIFDDGGYVERTGSYTSFVFGMFYRYMLLWKYAEDDTSLLETYLPRLEKLMEFTSRTLSPLGVNVPFNDSRRSLIFAGLLVDMGKFFNRGDFIGPLMHVVPEEKWKATGIEPELPDTTSELFPSSHFVVMREGWARDAYFMKINYGPFQNHGHYDILDFEAYANGIPIALDAAIGPTGYVDPVHVSWYKQAKAHNMLMVAEANPMKRNVEGLDLAWSTQEHMDYFAATHSGYQRYHDTLHRRHFAFRRGHYWLLVDEVETPHAGKALDWQFHTPLSLQETDYGFASTETPGVQLILPDSEQEATERFHRTGPAGLGELPGEPPSRDIDWITFRKGSSGNPLQDRMAVLIYPTKEDSPDESPRLTWNRHSKNPDVLLCRVSIGNEEDLHIFSDGTAIEAGAVSGSFTYAIVHQRDGQPVWVSATGATQLHVSGQTFVDSEVPVDGEWAGLPLH
ncbi:MAG: heparinase II/III family protein [Puniceicoccaceae bacterium]